MSTATTAWRVAREGDSARFRQSPGSLLRFQSGISYLLHSADLNIPTTVLAQLTDACFRKMTGASHVGPSAVGDTPTNDPIGRDFGP